MVYLVTYNFYKEPNDNDRAKIRDRIKQYTWARLGESCYAIDTYISHELLFNDLRPYLDKNDHLFVIPMYKPYSAYGASEVIDWLSERLPVK